MLPAASSARAVGQSMGEAVAGYAGDEEVVNTVAGDRGDGSAGGDLADAVVLLVGDDEVAVGQRTGRRRG